MTRARRILAAPIAVVAAGLLSSTAAFAGAAPPVPGPLVPETVYPDVAVTVTSPGDPATAVSLRAPFPVGASADTRSSWWYRGTETYTLGSTTSTSDWDFQSERVGVDEVVASRPDGTSTLRFTQTSARLSMVYSNPDHADETSYDPSVLDGSTVLVEFGAGRQSTAIYQDSAAPLTPEQVETATGDQWRMTIPMPAEPVGVGATWTWTEPTAYVALTFDVPYTARLDAVDGDRYTITVSYSVDIPTAAGLVPDESVVSVTSGSYAGTSTVTGSITNPLDYHEKTEITQSARYVFDSGNEFQEQGATTEEYWETPRAG